MTKTTTPKLIALFGGTGTGKTTFINDASGEGLQVGNSLESCTKEVTCTSTFQVDGEDFVLIDTPGFDDDELPDSDILKEIAGFLTATYENGLKLTGIIYLHRMTDNRVSGASRRTFNMFRELCGSENLSNVVIVANIWSDPPTPKEMQREKELQENPKFFQPALQDGARFAKRLSKDTDSAHDIIRLFVDKQPVVMNIQRQMVDNRQGLFDTDAAKVFGEQLVKMEQRHQEDIQQLTEHLEKAQLESSVRTQRLQRELDETKSESQRRANQAESLKQGSEQERVMWGQRLRDEEEKRKSAEKELAELTAELDSLRQQAANAKGEELGMLRGMIATVTGAIARLAAEISRQAAMASFRFLWGGGGSGTSDGKTPTGGGRTGNGRVSPDGWCSRSAF